MDREPNESTPSIRVWRTVRSAAFGAATAAVAAIAPAGATIVLIDRASGLPAPYGPAAAAAASVVTLAIVGIASARAHQLTRMDRDAIRVGYVVGVAVFLLVLLNPLTGGWRDASAYYALGLDNPYELAYASGGVRYSPPFFQLVELLSWLSWPAFLFLWTAGQLAVLWIIAGPIAALLLVVPVVALEAWYANINLLLAVVITWGPSATTS